MEWKENDKGQWGFEFYDADGDLAFQVVRKRNYQLWINGEASINDEWFARFDDSIGPYEKAEQVWAREDYLQEAYLDRVGVEYSGFPVNLARATVRTAEHSVNASLSLFGPGIALNSTRVISAVKLMKSINYLEEMVVVSRWGREGLQAGDWVMKGQKNLLNYVLSFKWQPGLGNEFASFKSGVEYLVPRYSVVWPKAKTFGQAVVDGVWKGIFNQRMYFP